MFKTSAVSRLFSILALATIIVGSTAGYLALQPAGKQVEAGVGWLTGWSYRKSHVINYAAGAGTLYQVKVIAHYGAGTDSGGDVYLNSHSRTDFGDIRFTDNDGITLLDYWMESKVDSDNAVFWVEVADDLSTANQSIFIYYGNASATTTSNGVNTFIFFDHFEGTSLDTNKWYASASTTVSNSKVDIYHTGNVWYGIWGKTSMTYGRWRCKGQLPNINDLSMLGLMADDYYGGYVPSILFYWNTAYSAVSYVTSLTYITLTSGTQNEAIYEILWKSGEAKFYIDGSLVGTKTDQIPTTAVPAGAQTYYATNHVYMDWVFLSKYVSPEPSHGSWGSEEVPNSSPYAPTLSSPAAGYRFNLSSSVTFSWSFSDPDAGDYQTAYQFQLDNDSDFSSPITDSNKVSSVSQQTAQTLPSTVGLYYWRVKTWDSKDAEGPYCTGRAIIVDRIKTTACGILNNVVDTRTGGAVWYTAVYESDSTPFTSTCGTLYLNSVAMVWAADRWTYTFPYQMSGSQAVFTITSVAESTYGLTGLNNVAGDLVLNWATMEISIVKP
jgi:hypothetical protein